MLFSENKYDDDDDDVLVLQLINKTSFMIFYRNVFGAASHTSPRRRHPSSHWSSPCRQLPSERDFVVQLFSAVRGGNAALPKLL